MLAGWMLLLNGTILLVAARRAKGAGRYAGISWRETVGIGFAQAFALLPGISRSGSTIAAGLHVGLDQTNAATFSFLLAIPAIAGAVLLEMIGIFSGDPMTTSTTTLLIGAVVAFVVGLFALALLNRWLQKGKLVYFAFWCWLVGLIVVIWQVAFV
jgi:undecaprenyl-diphosphatase